MGIKVLMVDDEEQFRATTKKILERKGFETILAESGEVAIEKLKENPDVVILDIKMPGMDGHQALREIKKDKPDIPVIMLTGHGALPSAREALVEGAYDYLTKPCDIELLASKVTDAYEHTKVAEPAVEKKVIDLMVFIKEFTTLTEDRTVQEAVAQLKDTFSPKVSTSRLMETLHRSILVLDNKGKVKGAMTITDLLKAIMPAYLSAPKPTMADSIVYSPMFWTGMFNKDVKLLAPKKIKDVMSEAPLVIDGDSNLMEAAHMMVSNAVTRLCVEKDGEVVGVIRQQDLFFEIDKIMRL
jgi:CheY-like chemotaxis protein